ncbi:MAG: hypothetical protein EON89_09850 [Brevundimonas sp.]|nr:MAG: hypothetical protein EON89_09850 [Brevundimonas sp.]
MTASSGYDPAGRLTPLPADRLDTTVGVFAEFGLADGLTVQLKGDWQSGEDAFVDYDGRGPLEIGVTWTAWRDDRAAVSLYAGYADGGEGRNAGYAPPGQGDSDWEVRASAGRSFASTRWTPDGFVELQAARRLRAGLPDETRLDATVGVRVTQDWTVLAQAYGGRTDGGGAQWLSVEASVVRDLGDWSLQAGWRQAAAGRETPRSGGPVVALWRRF